MTKDQKVKFVQNIINGAQFTLKMIPRTMDTDDQIERLENYIKALEEIKRDYE